MAATGNTGVPLRIEDIHYSGEPQYVFFHVRQLTEHGRYGRTWTVPAWLEPGPIAPPGADDSRLLASRNSKVFHVDPKCRDWQSIKPTNPVTGLPPDAIERNVWSVLDSADRPVCLVVDLRDIAADARRSEWPLRSPSAGTFARSEAIFFDISSDSGQLNVHAGEREVRPPHALTGGRRDV